MRIQVDGVYACFVCRQSISRSVVVDRPCNFEKEATDLVINNVLSIPPLVTFMPELTPEVLVP